MKKVKDKYLVVGADFADYPLKEAVVAHLKSKGCDIADAYLNAELGSGYGWWHNFYEFHKLAIDELEAFDYKKYKENGFKVEHLGDYPLKLETKPE